MVFCFLVCHCCQPKSVTASFPPRAPPAFAWPLTPAHLSASGVSRFSAYACAAAAAATTTATVVALIVFH
jgi:hypothetical protein